MFYQHLSIVTTFVADLYNCHMLLIDKMQREKLIKNIVYCLNFNRGTVIECKEGNETKLNVCIITGTFNFKSDFNIL